MNFVVSKSDLQNAISTVIKAVPSKSNLTNADCILLEARMDEVRLVANNSEMAIESIYSARVLEEGKICLDSKDFQEIVRVAVVRESDISYLTTFLLLSDPVEHSDSFQLFPLSDIRQVMHQIIIDMIGAEP